MSLQAAYSLGALQCSGCCGCYLKHDARGDPLVDFIEDLSGIRASASHDLFNATRMELDVWCHIVHLSRENERAQRESVVTK